LIWHPLTDVHLLVMLQVLLTLKGLHIIQFSINPHSPLGNEISIV